MAESSYAPSFIIKIGGSRLAVEREADIKEVIVIHRLDAPASCIIRAEDPDEAWSGDDCKC